MSSLDKKPQILAGKFNGKISFNDLEFSEVYTKEVKPANSTSGKIYLPHKLIGKFVYILIKSDKRKR